MKLFFDESGNSGADIFNAQQPLFAYAGVWLDPANEARFGSFLDTLRKRHRMNGSGELKGSKLLKTGPGRRAIADVLKELHARAVPISLIVVHKAYFAPGVLIDDCADSAYNPNFSQDAITDRNRCIEPVLVPARRRAQGTGDESTRRVGQASPGVEGERAQCCGVLPGQELRRGHAAMVGIEAEATGRRGGGGHGRCGARSG